MRRKQAAIKTRDAGLDVLFVFMIVFSPGERSGGNFRREASVAGNYGKKKTCFENVKREVSARIRSPRLGSCGISFRGVPGWKPIVPAPH